MSGSAQKSITDRAHVVWSVFQKALTICAVTILFAMMLLTSFDVAARYVFNSPVRGAFELTEIGLALLVYLALPVATVAGSHIAVDLLRMPKSNALRRAQVTFVKLVVAVTFGLISWQVWHHANKLLSYGQVTNSLEIPIAFVAFVVAFGAALSAIAAFMFKAP